MIKRTIYILSILIINTFLLTGCQFTSKILGGGEIKKFEKRSFNPNRKMSTEDRLIANKNERKNRKQDQLVVEKSGGIMSIPGVKNAENKGVKKDIKK